MNSATFSRRGLIWLIGGALGFSIGFMALIITIWQTGYAANDDAFLASIASGSLSGEPDGRMVFTGPLIGYPLAGLYSIWSSVPFYLYMEYLAMALSLAAAIVASVILSRRALIPVALGVIFLWFATFSQWLLNLAFTPIAISFTTVGLLLSLVAASRRNSPLWLYVAAGLIFSIGGFLRDDVPPRPSITLSVLLVLIPFFIFFIFKLGYLISLIFFGSIAAGFLINVAANTLAYAGPTWSDALIGESYRSSILDSPAMGASFLFAEKAGLTQNDYSLFYQNGYLDRTVFSPETLQRLVDVTSGATSSGQGFLYNPSLMWANFLTYSAPARSLLLVGIAFAIISLINLSTWRQRLVFLGVTLTSVGWYAAILFYLGESRKVADHVQIPITYIFLLLILLAPLAFMKDSQLRPTKGWPATLTRVGLAVVPALVIYFSFGNPLANLEARSEANIARQVSAQDLIDNLVTLDPEAIFIEICCFIPWSDADPTKPKPFDGWPVQIVGGWPTFTPIWERRNEILGISESVQKDPYGTTDLVEALITNPRVRLIATEQASNALAQQMRQNHAWLGCFSEIEQLAPEKLVYQATPQSGC